MKLLPESAQGKSFIDEAELATITGFEPQTIAKWRMIGKGPPFVRLGGYAIRYPVALVEKWLQDNLVQNDGKL